MTFVSTLQARRLGSKHIIHVLHCGPEGSCLDFLVILTTPESELELESEPEPEPMPRPELDSASMPPLEPTPEQDAQVLFISGGGGDDDASTLKFSSTNLGASC